jgi:hypothetical protein
MMGYFQKWLIGGATGSRQGAWFLVLALLIFPFWFLMIAEFYGIPMPILQSLLMVVGPAVLTLWAIAHGLQKAVDSKLFGKSNAP